MSRVTRGANDASDEDDEGDEEENIKENAEKHKNTIYQRNGMNSEHLGALLEFSKWKMDDAILRTDDSRFF